MLLCNYISSDLHIFIFFFFNDTATTEIYTLSLHDALPISSAFRPYRWSRPKEPVWQEARRRKHVCPRHARQNRADRKSTRLNSSHGYISYAVFCLKKKKPKEERRNMKKISVNADKLCSSSA